jgi:hypothetical protein
MVVPTFSAANDNILTSIDDLFMNMQCDEDGSRLIRNQTVSQDFDTDSVLLSDVLLCLN